jgi:hypothetical protein
MMWRTTGECPGEEAMWGENRWNHFVKSLKVCQKGKEQSLAAIEKIVSTLIWTPSIPSPPSTNIINHHLAAVFSFMKQLPLSSFLFPGWKCRKWRSIPGWKASAPSSLTRYSWRASGIRCTPAVRKYNLVLWLWRPRNPGLRQGHHTAGQNKVSKWDREFMTKCT